MNDSFETLSGMKIVWLVLGFIGAALGIRYSPPMSKGDAIAALGAGVVCAGFGPPLFAFWFSWKLPPVADNALAFVCGILGMFVVPGILSVGREFAANPWSFFDKLRSVFGGKGEGK